MPHFVIHCSETVLDMQPAGEIIREIFHVAEASSLFRAKQINVRVQSFQNHQAGRSGEDFIAVFASIMEGRTDERKNELSRSVVGKLIEMFPEVPMISMQIADIHKASYVNLEILGA